MKFDNSQQYSRQAVYFRLTPLEYKQTINITLKLIKIVKAKIAEETTKSTDAPYKGCPSD